MAYTSSTLALVNPGAGVHDTRIFTYVTPDTKDTIEGAGYFSDGISKGMRLGDAVLVRHVDSLSAPTVFEMEWYMVTAVGTATATVEPATAITEPE